MKVFVAKFSAECNEHIRHIVNNDDFHFRFNEECINSMNVKDIFEDANIEIVNSISAVISPNGMIALDTFNFIVDTMLTKLREVVNEIDGIYLQFHGASGVKGLDCVSGEYYILKKMREITGKYMPIAMSCDPHGNITQELCDYLNIIRCYRESPHSDTVDTQRKVANLLIDLMLNKRPMKPIIKKLPIMVGGERSVSAHEPIRSINALLDKAELDPRVYSCSYHVGFIRHDDDKLGAAVIVIPNTENDIEYCDQVACEISEYAWNHRHQFQFSGNFDEVDISVAKAIAYSGKTVVITDSGDNCGAGGYGENTIVLRELIKQKCDKKILVAGINDAKCFDKIKDCTIGDQLMLQLGVNEDEQSQSIPLAVEVVQIGEQAFGGKNGRKVGKAITVRVKDTMLDIIVVNHNLQYGYMEQFEAAGLQFHAYDIVVVKMGYLDTYLIPETDYHIMALSDGPTIQRSERIPFKKIARPMWPIDEFEELYYIK